MLRGNSFSGANVLRVRLTITSSLVASCLAILTATAQESKKDNPGADQPKRDALDVEWQNLGGTWMVKSHLFDGKELGGGGKFTFSKRKLSMEFPPGRYDFGPILFENDIEIDLKAQPKVMWEIQPGRTKDDGTTRTYIYRFRGDSLELCRGLRNRPTTFDGTKGSDQVLITLERVKSDKPKQK
jgi:uncharacterized protein (TIGR03067 family)